MKRRNGARAREIGRKREKKGRQAVELVTSSRFLDPGPETRLAILLYHSNKLVMRPARGSPLRQ